ncbi:MAG: DNA/RNA nuclease SfsA [Pseudomonadota bacterium]
MRFDPALTPATLIRRYKRFLADVALPGGEVITVHTPNTGAMTGCSEPGSTVWLRDADNPKRKYRYSWEVTESLAGVMIGVHTGITNRLVAEAIENGTVAPLQGYREIRSEVRYGEERSRIDLLLQGHRDGRDCYVEIKNVTSCDERGLGYFPDAVSSRASKHLRELMAMAGRGERAVIFFCVQRGDVEAVRPADEIDPLYGTTLRQALAAGVEALAYRARVSPEEVVLETPLPVVCEGRAER